MKKELVSVFDQIMTIITFAEASEIEEAKRLIKAIDVPKEIETGYFSCRNYSVCRI